MRHQWNTLPTSVRDRITDAAGPVHAVHPVKAGTVSEFAATLATGTGRYFCKAIRTDQPAAWMLRKELQAAPVAPGAALRWTFEADGWLVLGFEHVPGWHPDLAPGSPDLPQVASLLADLAGRLTPAPALRTFSLAQRWADSLTWQALKDSGRLPEWALDRFDELDALERQAPAAVEGTTLAHTDMCGPNILIHEGGARVIDWAWPAPAAAWLDTASMIPRLIVEGHSAAQAHAWAEMVPAFAEAEPEAVRAVASLLTARWVSRAAADGGVWVALADAGRLWIESMLAVSA